MEGFVLGMDEVQEWNGCLVVAFGFVLFSFVGALSILAGRRHFSYLK